MANPTKTTDSGSFGTGLFLGVVTGAAGMFLFGTKQGKKLLSDLKAEWQAKQADGTIPPLPQSVPELMAKVEKTVEKVKKTVQDPKFPKFGQRNT